MEVEVEHEGVTTDRGPKMRVAEGTGGRRVLGETEMWLGTGARRREVVDFVAPAGVEWVEVEMAREASAKFDNKVAGRVRVYGVSVRGV